LYGKAGKGVKKKWERKNEKALLPLKKGGREGFQLWPFRKGKAVQRRDRG
jgi:hypothetical protein